MRISRIAFLGVFLFCLVSCAQPKRPTLETTANFNAHLRKGSDYFRQGSYEEAQREFEAALALNPFSDKAHNFCGLALFWQKNYPAAESRFLKAIALNPSYATAYNNLGGVYAMKRQWSSAKEMLKKAISLSPDMASAYFSLGTVHFNLGETEEGTACLAKGIALDPDYLTKNSAAVMGLSVSDASLAELSFTYAKLYASMGNVERTVEFLTKAKQAGFRDWQRIARESEFEKVRDNPKIQEFLRD